MKIREDFVTNSSSSSYIIGKWDDESITIESIYQTLRSFYMEYIEKIEQAIQYIKEYIGLNILEEEEDTATEIVFNIYSSIKEKVHKNKEVKKKIQEMGIDEFDLLMYSWCDLNWLMYETYQEFEKHDGPFTIYDLWQEKERWESDRENLCFEIVEIIDFWSSEIKRKEMEGQGILECKKRTPGVWLLGRICISSWDGDIPLYVRNKIHEISLFGCDHM